MIEELIFTSAPRGLQIGKSGFCTVASTPGMSAPLARMLESLSGYRHFFAPGSADAENNPVVYSHLATKMGGRNFQILSRISDAGWDYSNRSNKLAHHVAIQDPQNLTCGPAMLLSNESLLVKQWDREPTKLPPRSFLFANSSPAPCAIWQQVAGDSGLAGDVMEAVLQNRPVYLIVNPATPALGLIRELMALLPLHKQWLITFSTFFTKLPPNVECAIRCVLADSPEVAIARRSSGNLVLDLTSPCGRSTSKWADFARAGKLIAAAIPDANVPIEVSGASNRDQLLKQFDKKTLLNKEPSQKNDQEFPSESETWKFENMSPPNLLSFDRQSDLERIARTANGPVQPTRSLTWVSIAAVSIFIFAIELILLIPASCDFTVGRINEIVGHQVDAEKPNPTGLPDKEKDTANIIDHDDSVPTDSLNEKATQDPSNDVEPLDSTITNQNDSTQPDLMPTPIVEESNPPDTTIDSIQSEDLTEKETKLLALSKEDVCEALDFKSFSSKPDAVDLIRVKKRKFSKDDITLELTNDQTDKSHSFWIKKEQDQWGIYYIDDSQKSKPNASERETSRVGLLEFDEKKEEVILRFKKRCDDMPSNEIKGAFNLLNNSVLTMNFDAGTFTRPLRPPHLISTTWSTAVNTIDETASVFPEDSEPRNPEWASTPNTIELAGSCKGVVFNKLHADTSESVDLVFDLGKKLPTEQSELKQFLPNLKLTIRNKGTKGDFKIQFSLTDVKVNEAQRQHGELKPSLTFGSAKVIPKSDIIFLKMEEGFHEAIKTIKSQIEIELGNTSQTDRSIIVSLNSREDELKKFKQMANELKGSPDFDLVNDGMPLYLEEPLKFLYDDREVFLFVTFNKHKYWDDMKMRNWYTDYFNGQPQQEFKDVNSAQD